MGQLVFQATLGGQVNLVGPNTASTFNLDVPAVSATLATTAANTFTAAQTFSAGSASAPAITTSGDTNTGIFFPAADTIALTTGGTERARVDSSGNLGLGVTPSAWGSNRSAIQVGTSGKFSEFIGSGNGTSFGHNVYWDGSAYKYINTGYASRIDYNYSTGGAWTWQIAASGTAGNAISFTQAMTLDASGNLGVGTSSPGSVLDVLNATPKITLRDAAGRTSVFLAPNSVDDGFIGTTSNHSLPFRTNNTERARIDSSGNLLVGATSGSGNNERVNITTNTNQTLRLNNTNATSGNISMVSILGANTDNTSSYHLLTSTNGGTRFYVYGNGTYGNASDQNLKKNIETTRDGYIEDLCRLRVVKYNWNGQEEGAPKELGWIAQEVEQVFPGLVQEGIPNENGETFKEVKTSVLPFMLLKALQELKAEFEAYKATHP